LRDQAAAALLARQREPGGDEHGARPQQRRPERDRPRQTEDADHDQRPERRHGDHRETEAEIDLQPPPSGDRLGVEEILSADRPLDLIAAQGPHLAS